jgi:putative DNA primase/helicase
MRDATNDFAAAILSALGHVPTAIEPGRLHRFSTNGKRSDTAGWYHLFVDQRAGVFGDFRAGLSEVWTATPLERMTPNERGALRKQMAEAKMLRERVQRDAWRKNGDRMRYLWRQCVPITVGDPVHSYLCRRLAVKACILPDCIRLHSAMPYVHEGEPIGTWPAMVAPIVAVDGRPLALHRTYLDAHGHKADVPGAVKKLTPAAGLLAGGSIRLHEPARGVIGVAEGIETALAASRWRRMCPRQPRTAPAPCRRMHGPRGCVGS